MGLGYVIDRRGGKEWEIAGVPQSVIGKFSKRTGEIRQKPSAGIVDPERKGELGAKTRQSKKKGAHFPNDFARNGTGN